MSGSGIRLCCKLLALVLALSGVSLAEHGSPLADHHAHLQSSTAARLLNEGTGQLPGTPKNEQKENSQTAAELIAQLDAAGIRQSIAISDAYRLGSPFVHVAGEATAVDAENEWTQGQVLLYPQRLVGFCSVNPTRPYALAAIKHCAQIGLRGGLKLHLANAQFNFGDPEQVHKLCEVVAAANRLHMPILIHLRSDNVWNAKRSVRVFLEQVLPFASHIPVQVAHLGGWGGYDRATDDALSTFADSCSANPQRCDRLYFDIAAVVLNPSDGDAVPGGDLRFIWDGQKDFSDGPSHLAANLRRIGLSRILFATDWPVVNATDYAATLRNNLRLEPGEIDQIFSNVAPYFITSSVRKKH